MRLSHRIGLGIALGLFLATFAHPLTRPFLFVLFNGIQSPRVIKQSNWIPENVQAFESTDALPEMAYQLLLGVAYPSRVEQKKSDTDYFLQVVERGGTRDPQNAFWPLSELVLRFRQDRKDPRISELLQRASNASLYEDYQTWRISKLREELREESRGQASWQDLRLTTERRSELATGISSVLTQIHRADPENPLHQSRTILAAGLVRQGARTLAGGQAASRVILLAESGNQPPTRSPVELNARRNTLIAKIRLADPELARATQKEIRENELWQNNLVSPDEDPRRNRTFESLLWATIPVASIGVMVQGLFFLLIAELLKRVKAFRRMLGWNYVGGIGAVFASILYLITNLIWPSVFLWVAIAIIPVAERKYLRSKPPRELTVQHTVTLYLFALASVPIYALMSLWLSRNILVSLDQLGLAADFFNSFVAQSTVIIVLWGLVGSTACLWGFVNKHRPTVLMRLTWRSFGMASVWLGLIVAIFSTSGALMFDRNCQAYLERAWQNEPTLYLSP